MSLQKVNRETRIQGFDTSLSVEPEKLMNTISFLYSIRSQWETRSSEAAYLTAEIGGLLPVSELAKTKART